MSKRIDIKELASNYSSIKELKRFCYIVSIYDKLDTEIALCLLCSERFIIYSSNDITLNKIREYLIFCDDIIKLLEMCINNQMENELNSI